LTAFLFVDATFRSRYAVSSAEVAEKMVRNLMFFAPQMLGEGSPEIFMEHFEIDTTSDLLAKFG